MLQDFVATNINTLDGSPAGGSVHGLGLEIAWQEGPLGEEGPDREAPNGAFVETVVAAALQRIEWYQEVGGGKFRCEENVQAITYLRNALLSLDQRTKDRQRRGVEGTHQV